MTNAQPTEHVERRLAAILAADVAGYSRLMGADEEGTLSRLKDQRQALFDPKITEHRGRIVKTTGDGLLVEFASVIDAVRCAVEVQRGMAERNAEVAPDQRMEFRIGINVGDIIIDGDDIYGDGVNVAARLEGLAEPGGICVSRTVRDQVRDKLDFGFQDMGAQSVKNIARPVRVHRVLISAHDVVPSAVPAARLRRDGRRASWNPVRRVGRAVGRAIRVVIVLLLLLIVAYRWVSPPMTPLMLADLVRTGKLAQSSVPLSAISGDLQRAVVASSDGKFCLHHGVSWGVNTETSGTGIAVLNNTESITMQLVQSLFLWPGSGTVVKLLDIALAYPIDLIWSKRRIMEVYLNVARWGDGIYGADAAAEAFFSKSAANLSKNQAALLAAVLPDPLNSSAARPSPYIIERAGKISGKMDTARFDYTCLAAR